AEPIFDHFDLEAEIAKATARKVWLKSGGHIVIDHTEAMTVIDVNTGRFVGKRDLEETITKTNLEAVKEIAYQLKLRSIGGIIIIDFRDIRRLAPTPDERTIVIGAHPNVASLLADEEADSLVEIERERKVKVVVKPDPTLHIEQYDIVML